MNELIQQILQQVNVSESTAEAATGGVLQAIQKQVGEADFSELLGQLPGAEDLISKATQAEEKSEESGSLMGGVMGMAAGAIGGKLGGALELTSRLEKLGLDAQQASTLVGTVVKFIKAKADSELVDRVLDQVPELKQLAG